MQVDHPISDMHVAGEAVGIIDFVSLKEVMPIDQLELGGRLEADLRWDTRMSYIEQEQYEQVDLDGSLLVENVIMESTDLPVKVELSKMKMKFNPRFVDLQTLDLILGSSDLHMDGQLSNFIPYLFNEQTVSGTLNVASQLLNANELMPQEELLDEAAAASDTIAAVPPDSLAQPARVKIPANIDFALALEMEKVIYEEIVVENISGDLKVREGVAYLEKMRMEVIQGVVNSSGMVDTRGDFTEVDVSLDMKGVDIPEAYKTFVSVERLAPMAKYCRGTANITMQYHSYLDESFLPLYESIDAKGKMFTRGLQIYDLNTFVRISELLKNEKFKQMAPDEVDMVFTVKNGRIRINPFDMDIDNSRITVSGSHGIDMTLDYLLDMNIAKSDLGAGANDIMSGISLLAAGAGFKMPPSDYVKVKAKIGGTFNKPKVSTDLSGNLRSSVEVVEEIVKQRVEEEIKEVEEEVREEAGEKAEEIIAEAEAEAEQLIAEARKIGADLVKEAEIQGENLLKEAGSNPLKQFAAKKAAEELNRQAVKQSENLVNEAEIQADEIIQKARVEAEKL